MISIKEKIFQITRETISEFELIHKKDKIIIGISGGADSLSLFLILNEFKKEYDLTLLLAHMNHKLRGLESDEDQKFIIRLAQKYKTPVKIKTVDIPALKTKNKKLSLEEIAHHERSEFFLTLLKKEGYNSIALGHNLDDSVENFFLRACNLSSLRSISGIKPKQGSIIRPLTNCLKKDLEEFAGSYNIRIRKDRSNGDNSIPRNWIRNKMVPYIEKNYKPIKKQVSHLLNILYYENDLIEGLVNETMKKVRFSDNFYSSFFKLSDIVYPHIAMIRRITEKILIRLKRDYNYYMIDSISRFIMNSKKKSLKLDELFIWKHSGYVIITLNRAVLKYKIEVPLKQQLNKINIENLNLYITIKEIRKDEFILDKHSLFFDKKRLLGNRGKADRIIIRQKKIGDYIVLMNTGFKTSLKKFFIDCKITEPLKKMVPVVEVQDRVAGLYMNIFPVYLKNRIHDKFKVTDKTEKIIKMEFEQSI